MATTPSKPAKPAARKPAAKKPAAKTSTDYLQEAIGDIDKARETAKGQAGAQLDRAAERLRTLASDLRDRAEDEVQDFQASLDRASEHLRVELGLRAIRAQDSAAGLTQLSTEIRKRRAELAKK